MITVPSAAGPLSKAFREGFTAPTFRRFVVLMIGLIVTMGRRSVSRTLRITHRLLPGHWCNYHRLYSSARFSLLKLGRILVRQAVALLPADGVIELAADDTVTGKTGDRIWAMGVHRDSVRSSHKHDRMKFGHRWLVLCVLVRLPGLARPWALPLLCGLCLSQAVATKVGRRPKTPAQLARQFLICLMRWLPGRKFVLIGDFLVVSHATVVFAQRHANRITVIGRLRGDANLYHPPKVPSRRTKGGQLAQKGRKAQSPCRRVAHLKERTRRVQWYGGSRRRVRYVTETGLWYSSHHAKVTRIRWVAVLADTALPSEHNYFFCSDPTQDAVHIIEWYASRWNIEVTFEEIRAHLGLETTRHRCQQSVLRVTPLLFGLFTIVVLLWRQLPKPQQQSKFTATPCYSKAQSTYADALGAVRHELWKKCLLQHCDKHQCVTRLPRTVRRLLFWHLAAAA